LRASEPGARRSCLDRFELRAARVQAGLHRATPFSKNLAVILPPDRHA